MNKILVILAINMVLGGLLSLALSITIINSVELRIVSASFLLMGLVILPVGMGIESETERILRLEAEAFKHNVRRILEEFMVYEKKIYVCPSNLCKITSIMIPIGSVDLKYHSPANRFITVYKDMLMLMFVVPGSEMLRNMSNSILGNKDPGTLGEIIKDLISTMFGSSVKVSVIRRGDRYIIVVNGISGVDEFESWIVLSSLIGSIVAESLGKVELIDKYVFEPGTLRVELIET